MISGLYGYIANIKQSRQPESYCAVNMNHFRSLPQRLNKEDYTTMVVVLRTGILYTSRIQAAVTLPYPLLVFGLSVAKLRV